MAKYRTRLFEDVVTLAKALADAHRIRALLALSGGELCACQLIALLGLAPSTVSKHMSILRHARLVEVRKNGRWVHFRQIGAEVFPEGRAAIDWLEKALADTPSIREDARRLRQILRIDPETLCRRFSRD